MCIRDSLMAAGPMLTPLVPAPKSIWTPIKSTFFIAITPSNTSNFCYI